MLKEYLTGDTPREIAEEFKIIQSQNHRCTNNTLSFVLGPAIEDGKHMTPKEFGELARESLKEMKLTNHQAIAFVQLGQGAYAYSYLRQPYQSHRRRLQG